MKKRYFIYLFVLIAMLLAQFFGVFNSLEYSVSDRFYQNGAKVNNNVYVIGIDETTLSDLGDFQSFSRSGVADLINTLMADEKYAPSIIAIDIAYFSYKQEDIDAKLVEAVKNAGNVVFVDTMTFGSTVEGKNSVIMVEEPFDELYDAALAVGYSNFQMSDDGVVRYGIGQVEFNGKIYKSFSRVAYEEYCKKEGIELNLNEGFDDLFFYINYAGKPRTFYGSVGAGCSFSKVLDGSYPNKAFKDSIVFVGAYATGLMDNYYTSIDKQTNMYGVEIHANTINQFLNNDFKQMTSNYLTLGITFVLAVISLAIATKVDPKFSFIINLAILALYIFGCKFAYSSLDIILPISVPVITSAILIVVAIAVEVITSRKEKKAIIDKYSKFLSPELAKMVAQKGEDSIKLGGERKDLAVLFVDIRNFTTISESLTPEGVVEFLYNYYQLTTKAILDNEGTLDKFVGDETMGIFNAPLDIEDYLEKAIMAGLDMIKMYPEFDAKLPENLRGKVGFGIGVHCGEAVVGNVGTEQKMEYTAIGDTVNTAARLQGQAKFGQLVISRAAYDRVKDKFDCEFVGTVKLKGKAEEAELFSVLGKK